MNGIKWNGIGYDEKGNIIYKLKNGRGYIKELDYFGRLIYEGEYINGKRNGNGKEYYKNKLIYDGIYLYNYRRKGKEYVNDKLEFEGEYLYNKKWNGIGYDKNDNIIYELKNGNGKVKEYLVSPNSNNFNLDIFSLINNVKKIINHNKFYK